MQHNVKSRQAGVSFFGLIFVLAVLASVGVLGAQAFPTVLEYQAALKALEKAKAGSSPQEVRAIFDKAAQIDDIKSITGKDLEITRDGDKNVVKFAYTKEIHMFGPAFLALKYVGQSK
jgi:sensor histidine kinase regulating citrate/malate metabolism